MTKEQYILLEDFSQRRVLAESLNHEVEALRQAARAAISIIPFAKVKGMEYIATGEDPELRPALAELVRVVAGTLQGYGILEPAMTRAKKVLRPATVVGGSHQGDNS